MPSQTGRTRRRGRDSSLRCRQNEIAVKPLFRCGQSFLTFSIYQRYSSSYKGVAIPSRGDRHHIEVGLVRLHDACKVLNADYAQGYRQERRCACFIPRTGTDSCWCNTCKVHLTFRERSSLADTPSGRSTSSHMAMASNSTPTHSIMDKRALRSTSSRLRPLASSRLLLRTRSGL